MTRVPGCLPAIIPDSAAVGLVQMSDANGNLSWQPITATDLPAATGSTEGAIQLTGDLGNTAASPQVTSTHLSAALPVNQGGTNATSAGAALTSLGAMASASDLSAIATANATAGNVAMNSHKITGLSRGTSATDAAVIGQATIFSPSVARYSGVSGQAPREAFPYWAATGNQTTSAGVMYLALLPVCPGDIITNIGFVTGTTGATFGSSGYHWWTALYDNTATLIAQSADQTNTAIANGHAYLLALGSPAPYTVPSNVTYLYAAVMINTGTGGSPVQPTLRGPSQNVALVDSTTSLWPTAAIASATNGSSLGATAPSGTITLAASASLQYLGAS